MNQGRDTRTALLRAARRLFAELGYEGTSIRAITERAGANLGAITYHFGSKEALYEAVLDAVASPFLERIRPAVLAATSPLDAVEAVVRGYFAHVVQYPDWPALMAHELALDHPVPAPLQRTMRGLMQLLSGRIRAGQADGSIVAGNPMLLTFSIVSQPMYIGLVRRRLRDVFALDSDDPATRKQIEEHVVRVVRRSLATSGRSSS